MVTSATSKMFYLPAAPQCGATEDGLFCHCDATCRHQKKTLLVNTLFQVHVMVKETSINYRSVVILTPRGTKGETCPMSTMIHINSTISLRTLGFNKNRKYGLNEHSYF